MKAHILISSPRLLWLFLSCATPVFAQLAAPSGLPSLPLPASSGYAQCASMPDSDPEKLRCYNQWTPPPLPAPVQAEGIDECKDQSKPTLMRKFGLHKSTDCPSLSLRGWRPVELSVIASDSVNTVPSSPAPSHTAAFTPYQRHETRIQVSVRTKIASGLLTGGSEDGKTDSLWFGYTSQSYWQIFNSPISRPFRNTDHEPEVFYVFPLNVSTQPGWHWRYGGIGLVHQSNGQGDPLSRSWNRTYLMTGMENIDPLSNRTRFTVEARAWKRASEADTDDDNPDISDNVGRGELDARWHVNPKNILGMRVRHPLKRDSNGSVHLDWYRKLSGKPNSAMYTYIGLFRGYGDSLLDYNRKRTVLTLGLSLLDW
jgi:phospholipase A1/A2